MTSSSNAPPSDGYIPLGKPRERCVDCNARAPQTETNFTLISQRHGWRLTRMVDEQTGRRTMEWRCPTCFARHRGR